MWIFSTNGFFSAVEDGQIRGNILVRFRDPSHAEAFLATVYRGRSGRRVKIRETPPPADYRWKLSITRDQFSDTLARMALGIDYNNFKGACGRRKPSPYKHATLASVWDVMHRHQGDVLHGESATAGPMDFDYTPPLFDPSEVGGADDE